jgi:hypothetical protein
MKNLGVVIVLVAGLVIGYFAGREHLKYEMRSAFSSAAEEFSARLSGAFGTSDTSEPRVAGEKVEAEEDAARKAAEQAERAEQRAYIRDNLALYDLRSKYYESMVDGKVPGVEFKLKNNGDRALSRVDVTVYFKDESGSVIFEKSYSPVLVSEYSFSGNNDPLKPGYIWQQERGRFYSAKDVPTEWAEGSVEAAITRIEFSVAPE